MFYAIAYVLTSLASFGIVLLLSREGFEADRLDDFRGLNQRSPWWAFIMLLVMFSLAGMPPTVGFYAKFAGASRRRCRRRLRLARRGRGARVAGRRVLLPAHRQAHVLRRAGRRARRSRRAATARALLSVNGLALLLLGILPQPLMGLCVLALQQSRLH